MKEIVITLLVPDDWSEAGMAGVLKGIWPDAVAVEVSPTIKDKVKETRGK